jgi:hypothetical protein
VTARFKAAWCAKCNADRPYRVVPGTSKRGALRTVRRKVCLTCGEDVAPSAPKYGNVPTRSKHTGRTFQSKLEAGREPALIALQNVGAISDLRYQVPFRLELYATGAVDALLEVIESVALTQADVANKYTAIPRLAVAIRRSRRCVAKYVADFTYQQDGSLVVEDPKGARTPTYKIKRELMILAHDVEIIEPGEGGVQQRARGAGVAGRGTGSRLMGGR